MHLHPSPDLRRPLSPVWVGQPYASPTPDRGWRSIGADEPDHDACVKVFEPVSLPRLGGEGATRRGGTILLRRRPCRQNGRNNNLPCGATRSTSRSPSSFHLLSGAGLSLAEPPPGARQAAGRRPSHHTAPHISREQCPASAFAYCGPEVSRSLRGASPESKGTCGPRHQPAGPPFPGLAERPASTTREEEKRTSSRVERITARGERSGEWMALTTIAAISRPIRSMG